MDLQKKYDAIIDHIEQLVGAGVEDIPQELVRKTGLNSRLLADAFLFIADMTLIKYIRQRRLVHALLDRLENNLSVEEVAANTVFCDTSAFSKACKSVFNLSPGQITKELLEQYPPLHFSVVISDGYMKPMEKNSLTTQEDHIAMVSSEQFAEIKDVLEISALYGFDDDEAEWVYRMSKNFDMSIEAAAELCEEVRIEEKYDLYPSEMQQALAELKGNGFSNLHKLPAYFWDVYLSEENSRCGWYVDYVCEIAEALERCGMSANDLDQIAMHADTYGVDIVEAIENFEEYEKEWDDMIYDAMVNGIPEEDTNGFGYRSIWELDEE